jgi:hypothetical protein
MTAAPARKKSDHLMCGTQVWGVSAFLACSYFAWLSYSHVRHGEFDWPHDPWSIATYVIWVLLMVGLTVETGCWRERIFFGLVLANFGMGFLLTVWSHATLNDIRNLRVASAAVWGLAAVASLSTIFNAPSPGVRSRG